MKVPEAFSLEQKEQKKLVNEYRRLLRAMPERVTNEEKKEVRKAFNFAMIAHRDVRRKSGEPYIFHPISVALICAREMSLGATSVVSALLHDVVEDTEYTLEDIESVFGTQVARIIDGLTKISGVVGHSNSIQAKNFRKVLLTMARDVRVILVKLADRLHNMRTLGALSQHKQLRISSETLTLFAPLAHRLGLYSIKTEMEDLVLKYTQPEVYQAIEQKLRNTKNQRYNYIRKFVNPIRYGLDKMGVSYEIKWRTKSIYSIHQKMQRQDIPFEEVYDLFAIRIILDSDTEQERADCWKAYSLVSDHYSPNVNRLRDWISMPKTNGYESLHCTFMGPGGRWVEVQIRSRRMHEIAEKGFAAHWRYKGGAAADAAIEEWLNRVRSMLENPASDAVEFLDDFRMHLYEKEVYVFTPKGELRTLPSGSTALDYAFDIHTKVGYHCLGAKVNQKLVPISQPLRHGDQVEILTSKKQKPVADWLRFVSTSKARTQIKRALKERQREVARTGKEVLLRKARQFRVKLTENNLNRLSAHFKVDNSHELFYLIGMGELANDRLMEALKGLKVPLRKNPSRPPCPRPTEAQAAGQPLRESILVDGQSSISYTLAPCCKPIPGDDIFGHVSVDNGVRIHRCNCPNGINLMARYGYRTIEVKWARHVQAADQSFGDSAAAQEPKAPVAAEQDAPTTDKPAPPSYELPAIAPPQHAEKDKPAVAPTQGLALPGQTTFPVAVKLSGIDSVGMMGMISEVVSEIFKTQIDQIFLKSKDGAFEGDMLLQVSSTQHLQKLLDRLNQLEGIARAKRVDPNTMPDRQLKDYTEEEPENSADLYLGAKMPFITRSNYS